MKTYLKYRYLFDVLRHADVGKFICFRFLIFYNKHIYCSRPHERSVTHSLKVNLFYENYIIRECDPRPIA